MDEMMTKLMSTSVGGLLYVGLIQQSTMFQPRLEHLTCFLPGNLALGVAYGAVNGSKAGLYMDVAKNLTYTCWQMYERMPMGTLLSLQMILLLLQLLLLYKGCQWLDTVLSLTVTEYLLLLSILLLLLLLLYDHTGLLMGGVTHHFIHPVLLLLFLSTGMLMGGRDHPVCALQSLSVSVTVIATVSATVGDLHSAAAHAKAVHTCRYHMHTTRILYLDVLPFCGHWCVGTVCPLLQLRTRVSGCTWFVNQIMQLWYCASESAVDVSHAWHTVHGLMC